MIVMIMIKIASMPKNCNKIAPLIQINNNAALHKMN